MNKMMKFVVVLLMLGGISCSSDADSNAQIEPPSVFTIAVNGEDFTNEDFNTASITKTEDTILIDLYSNYGQVMLSFNKSGQLGYFNVDRNTGNQHVTSLFYSSYFKTSDNFTFNLISIDEVNKRVKGSYSGYIYSDPRNINSEKKFVTGQFDVKYEDNIPAIFGLTNKAKINGTNWLSMNKYLQRSSVNNSNIIQHDFSGGEYEISTSYNYETMAVGIYNFTSSEITQKVELAKYNSVTGTSTVYNSTGVLTITNRNSGIISGTYSFTAVNPNNSSDVIQVTDGLIKFVYYNF